jgi:hypothetical protein
MIPPPIPPVNVGQPWTMLDEGREGVEIYRDFAISRNGSGEVWTSMEG